MAGELVGNPEAQDKRTSEGEVLPEFQTLNSVRFIKFMKDHGISISNVDTDLTPELGIKLTKSAKSETDRKYSKQIEEANNLLGPLGKASLLMINDRDRFNSELNDLIAPPVKLTAENAGIVRNGWENMLLIRDKAKRLLAAEDRIIAQVRGEKMGAGETLWGGIKEQVGKVGKQWDKWDTKDKLIFAAGALIASIWFFNQKEENSTVGTIKKYLKTGVLALGGAWMGNKVYELVTGKSLLDTARSSTRETTFFQQAFKTDDKRAELISKSFALLGNESFLSLAEKYQRASAPGGNKKIEGTSMSPDEAYLALETFFLRFGLDKLRREFRHYDPPISFNQAAVIAMSRDPEIKMADNIAKQVVDGTGDALNNGYNLLATTRLAEWFGEKYRATFKREPSKEEIVAFAQRFSIVVKDVPALNEAIDNKIATGNVEAGKHFKNVFAGNEKDVATGIKYGEKNDDYTYLIVEEELASKVGDSKKLEEATKGFAEKANTFVANKYSLKPEEAAKKVETMGSVFIVATGRVAYFARYKRK